MTNRLYGIVKRRICLKIIVRNNERYSSRTRKYTNGKLKLFMLSKQQIYVSTVLRGTGIMLGTVHDFYSGTRKVKSRGIRKSDDPRVRFIEKLLSGSLPVTGARYCNIPGLPNQIIKVISL